MEGRLDKDEKVCPPQLPKSEKRPVKRVTLELEDWTTTARDETINNSEESEEPLVGCAPTLNLPCEKWTIGDNNTRNNSDLGPSFLGETMEDELVRRDNYEEIEDLTANSQEIEMPSSFSPTVDNSQLIILKEIFQICAELNLPLENLNIDRSDWVTGLHETLLRLKKLKANKKAGQPSSQRSIPCIYKVPEELRALKESAYKPRVVSIGPIHSNNERLNPMQDIKSSYGKNLCSRMGGEQHMSETLERCRSAMADLEANVKKCYAEKVQQNSLAEMMLIDGCFILELLYRSYCVKKELLKISNNDPVFSSPMRLLAIRHDLLLLENQIPFFVLEKLFSLTVECMPDRHDNLSLTKYILSFFGNIFSFGNDTLTKKVDTTDYHVLHLLHKCYLPSHDPSEGEEDHIKFPKSGKKKFRFPSALDLVLAGVKFVPRAGEDLFNVDFIKPQGLLQWCHGARFEIPAFSIFDGTESLLRNLIAFEQCCPNVPRHITSFGFFMDTLINSAEDVKLLEKAEILHNYMGTSEEASGLFNNICKEIVVGRFYFEKKCEAAGNHCSERWPRFLASLKRDYFANPWSGIAVFAAIFMFVLTIVQTVYTVVAYY